MNLEATELSRVTTRRFALPGLRWGAIVGGMCVGTAIYVMLMLAGICAGIANFAGIKDGVADISGSALAWNLAAAMTAAVAGAFITARSADIRRLMDGVIHGVVAWGATALLAGLVVVFSAREVTGGLVMMIAGSGSLPIATADSGQRVSPQALRIDPTRDDTPSPSHRNRLSHLVSMDGDIVGGEWIRMPTATSMELQQMTVAPSAKPAMSLAIYTALMCCAALAISFFGGIAGGLLGTRSPRRRDPMDHANWREVLDSLNQ
jgi:hypothetical protein